MKIGEFAKKFNVSVSAVRYYINLGLLLPEKNGYQYNFTETECKEMSLIETMKNTGFKLSEMNEYISLSRFYNDNDYILYEKMLEFLKSKKEAFSVEREKINNYIYHIDKKIHEIEDDCISSPERCTRSEPDMDEEDLPGFPLSAVSLLYCPECSEKLHLSDVEISGDCINKGKLTCQCGYSAYISDGALFTGEMKDLDNDHDFLESYFGPENITTNEESMFLMGMNFINNEYLTNFHKSGVWIQKELRNIDLKDKVVMFPDISFQYLYSHYGDNYDENNIFIVTALTERTIHAMRRHLANSSPKLKVVYIINQDGRLPLRNGCIDIIIDYLGTSNLGFFINASYFDMISRYTAPDATVIGTAEYYDKGSPSLKRAHELYPYAEADVCTLGFLRNALIRNGFRICKTDVIAKGYDPGYFFEYHIKGDIRTNVVFLCERGTE